MNRLADIPIQVIEPSACGSAKVVDVLRQIRLLLDLLLESGQASTIDLRNLPPLGENGYQLLKDTLGSGEVSARIDSFGCSVIAETACSGVWWVTHYNQNDEVLTELIEISYLPELLKSPRDDVAAGLARLDSALQRMEAE